MVRVNHPPGGATKLHTETNREPKTVRVLKPPGGGSSISFSDDDKHGNNSAARNGSSSFSPASPASPSAKEDPPTFEAATAPEASPVTETVTDSPPSASVDVPAPREATPPPSKATNGTTPQNEPVETPSEPSSPVIDSPQQSPVSDGPGDSDVSAPDVVSANVAQTNGSNERVNEVSSETVEEREATTVTVEESHESSTSTEISSVEERMAVASLQSIDEAVISHKENGLIRSPEKAPSPDPSPCPVPDKPSSPTSPTPKANGDAKDKMFAQATTPTAHTPQPRKIKDHMRSNIFMSDEDYTPTRSSRMNAAVITDPSPNVPAAGQRQRIPPGGFSTKLW